MATARAPLLSLDDAWQRLAAAVSPLAGAVEQLPLCSADGRYLATDLCSALDVPGFDNSAMDGYAVRAAEVIRATAQGSPLTVSQRIPAGVLPTPLEPGSVARIFTGAVLPLGADAVIMQEAAQLLSSDATAPAVRFSAQPFVGQFIRRRAEDVAQGQVVLSAGTRLGPAELGLAASLGCATLPVRSPLRVALFSSGDELVQPGSVAPAALPVGAIYDANRCFLRPLLQRLGCEVHDAGTLPDDRPATTVALQTAAQNHDLIVTSGGVSVGEEDHVRPVVQTLGELALWQVAIKPGKPFAFGWLPRGPAAQNRCHFVGLPGNPVSSFVTCLLLLRPLLRRLQGACSGAWLLPPALSLPAHFAWPQPDSRREFLRVRRNAVGGLDLFPNQSSGVLTSVVWCDGWVDVQPGQTIAHGDHVAFIPMSAWFDGH